jgi:hypothetical protein
MSRYTPNPSNVTATFEVFPKGDYEFTMGKPKAFEKKDKDVVVNFGVRVPLTINDGQYKGKKTSAAMYFHNEGSESASKRFQMAALGFKNNKEAEEAFNLKSAELDWSFDQETGDVSDIWKQFEGKQIVGVLDVDKNKNTGEPMQQFKSWRPVGS